MHTTWRDLLVLEILLCAVSLHNFGIVVFVKKHLIFFLFFFLFFWVSGNKSCRYVRNLPWLCQESVMALWGVRHGSTRSLSWLYEVSAMALPGVMVLSEICHSSGRNPSPLESGSCFYWQYPTLTDFPKSHDRLLAEPWPTPGEAMMDFFLRPTGLFLGFQKLKKICENINKFIFITKTTISTWKCVSELNAKESV